MFRYQGFFLYIRLSPFIKISMQVFCWIFDFFGLIKNDIVWFKTLLYNKQNINNAIISLINQLKLHWNLNKTESWVNQVHVLQYSKLMCFSSILAHKSLTINKKGDSFFHKWNACLLNNKFVCLFVWV
jgi:hypothetical protein